MRSRNYCKQTFTHAHTSTDTHTHTLTNTHSSLLKLIKCTFTISNGQHQLCQFHLYRAADGLCACHSALSSCKRLQNERRLLTTASRRVQTGFGVCLAGHKKHPHNGRNGATKHISISWTSCFRVAIFSAGGRGHTGVWILEAFLDGTCGLAESWGGRVNLAELSQQTIVLHQIIHFTFQWV